MQISMRNWEAKLRPWSMDPLQNRQQHFTTAKFRQLSTMMHTARCWKKGLARNGENFKVIYTYEVKSKVENKAAQVEVKDETFTVYISGIDVYGAIETNSRSDVNILAVVNPNTHQVLLVTTSRDYYVQIPGISGDMRDKLTHAGIYGVDASMSTLGQMYNTSIEFYARVNFTSLVEMVDALVESM